MAEPQKQLMLFALRGATPTAEEVEIVVYDVIGKSFWGGGVGAADVIAKLQSAPKAKKIRVRVNSRGGILDEAKAMVNLLHEKAAQGVTIDGFVDGIAASSASFLLTAATKVIMPSNAFQMVHQVRAGIGGTAGELEAAAALMRRNNTQLAEAYAAASSRRGKNKTAAEFLAAFDKGDLYLDADQAIEWGLADQKLEPLKMVACLVDLSADAGAPAELLAAPYVVASADDPRLLDPPSPVATEPTPIPPTPEGRQPNPANLGEENSNMSIPKFLITALLLADDAEEAAVTSAITKLKNSASIGTQIEQLLGTTGPAALGAVRALKEEQERNGTLATEVAKLKIVNARREFDGLVAHGKNVTKNLTPFGLKQYGERFEAAVRLSEGENGDADKAAEKALDVCADLKSYLAIAPRTGGAPLHQASVDGPSEGLLLHNGKRFEELKPIEQKRLKDSNVDLYNTMREDAQTRGAI